MKPIWLLLASLLLLLQPGDDITVRTVDGVEMVRVPAGCFTMGNPDGYPAERPAHEQCIERDFWIDRYEVTNAQATRTPFERPAASDAPDAPRVNVSWVEAQRHCAARGGRLPTEAEWEYAARGPSGGIYLNGDIFEPGTANICDTTCPHPWQTTNIDDGYARLAPVGAFPAGSSWVGALDMLGNVWEWTSSVYNQHLYPYPYAPDDGREDDPGPRHAVRVLRGGSWATMPNGTTTTIRRAGAFGSNTGDDIGFRCVMDANDAD